MFKIWVDNVRPSPDDSGNYYEEGGDYIRILDYIEYLQNT